MSKLKLVSKEQRVSFVTEDERVMFEVTAGKDGRSLEIRAVDTCRVGGELYSDRMEVLPIVSNVVEIRTRKYEE